MLYKLVLPPEHFTIAIPTHSNIFLNLVG